MRPAELKLVEIDPGTDSNPDPPLLDRVKAEKELYNRHGLRRTAAHGHEEARTGRVGDLRGGKRAASRTKTAGCTPRKSHLDIEIGAHGEFLAWKNLPSPPRSRRSSPRSPRSRGELAPLGGLRSLEWHFSNPTRVDPAGMRIVGVEFGAFGDPFSGS